MFPRIRQALKWESYLLFSFKNIYFSIDLREREREGGGREREREGNVDLLHQQSMHSLLDSSYLP